MGRLHCTQDPVPEAVGGDMQQLNQLGAQFSALTEVLFHFLTEPKEVERFLSQLSEFATTNQISLGPLRSIVKSLLLVPNGALKKSLTADQVRTDLITLGLSEEKATYFSEKWKQSAPTLARWAIGHTLMINQLVDMEWKFGVTSGSSELEKVGSIFLQLKLVVKKGNQTENLYIGESEFLLEPFHFFHVLCNQWACETPQIISSRKKAIPELWSSHSTASSLINNKPSAGWRPHS
ncbi:COMM domain-containing protein 7 isoform X2 [Enhydra lutris kenyoni]|uniref:COMM domain-containing protein 7 isoform X2 n=1 Tax=Enhydra lutris kenyoni TaxID=391180 RepID=A0A2Y9INS4_ENHLU|nr:COMM domain-containing protein 7 isoform X2 [Enhydra lutris kenyoni]